MARNIQVVRIQGRGAGERDFIDFPKRLYRGSPQWVPWFDLDMRALVRRRHPYFAQASGDFFVARDEGRTVGRACVTKNPAYIRQHGASCAHFYFFDVIDDGEVAAALVERLSEWARAQGLAMLRGPMLLGGASGSGILVQGFEHRAAMTMMPYNYPYYGPMLERLGFVKHVDLYSMELPPGSFRMSERVTSVADKVLRRGRFAVVRFASKRDLLRVAAKVAALYNETLGDHLEDYPLSEAELRQLEKDLLLVADPRLIKVLTYDGEVVGYLFAFRDLSEALQRNSGRLGLVALARLFAALRRGDGLIVNGMGILPQYQRLGGNALLYAELARTVAGAFRRAELVQVSERTELMLRDIETLGGRVYKVHRMYERPC